MTTPSCPPRSSLPSLPFRPDSPWLAPLAGWSDLPFRLLCREHGAAVCCTEMISAKGLVYGGRNTDDLLLTTPQDSSDTNPLVAQVFGAESYFMGEAVRRLKDRGFVWFDVNMGCSVHKVAKTGSGSAMLRDVSNALVVAKAVIDAAGPGQAGFKFRLGWQERADRSDDVYLDLAQELQALGAGWLTLHPRYASQKFSGVPRFSALKELVQAVSIPVIASGDLFQAEDGLRVLAETGVATVMYARGALADPAIFDRHKKLLHHKTNPAHLSTQHIDIACSPEDSSSLFQRTDTPEERQALVALIRRHAELAQLYSNRTALLKMRTFVPRYVKHLAGSKSLRQKLITCTDWGTLDAILAEIPAYRTTS